MQPAVHDLSGSDRAKAREAVDFAFLARQTFDDVDLQREILGLFVAQASRILPGLPTLPEAEQFEAAHLLTGSARAIGAWQAAGVAQAFGHAGPVSRQALYVALLDVFRAAERAIEAHLGQSER